MFTALLSVSVLAVEIPTASGKALGVTKGRPFSEGMVFINGRYIEPPYVVERWGVGIRINGTPAIASVIDWTEFIRTQDGVKVTKTEAPAEPEPVEPEPEEDEEELEDDDSMSSLDDLFDDEPKPKKEKKPAKRKKSRPRTPRKPTATVTYSLEGDFVPNEASKALVAKINKVRTDLNTMLLKGGFACFGDGYSRVTGDARTADRILQRLPDIQKKSTTEESFIQAVRTANLVFLPEPLCVDLFRNRRDYLKLQRRQNQANQDRDLKRILDSTTNSTLL